MASSNARKLPVVSKCMKFVVEVVLVVCPVIVVAEVSPPNARKRETLKFRSGHRAALPLSVFLPSQDLRDAADCVDCDGEFVSGLKGEGLKGKFKCKSEWMILHF